MAKGALKKLTMLSPMSVNWDAIPGSGGLVFTASDVAAALSSCYGLSRGAQLLGWALSGDQQAEKELCQQVMGVIDMHCQMVVQEETTSTLQALAKSAVEEFIQLSKCEKCRGSGKVIARAKPDLVTRDDGRKPNVQVRHYVTCDRCKGHGVIRWSERRAAREAGLTRQTYGRRYRDLREAGYQSLVSWLLELTAHLKTHLNYS
jgi:hypothetical protein